MNWRWWRRREAPPERNASGGGESSVPDPSVTPEATRRRVGIAFTHHTPMKEKVMDIVEKNRTGILWENGDSGVAPLDPGLAALAVPLGTARVGVRRPASVIQQLETVEAGSEEEVFRKFNVRITGAYRGLAGEEVTVDHPVTTADDYTINGLVNTHDGLHALYVGTCTAEAVMAELENADRPPLDENESEALESVLADLSHADVAEE
jgi:hypothetical protein